MRTNERTNTGTTSSFGLLLLLLLLLLPLPQSNAILHLETTTTTRTNHRTVCDTTEATTPTSSHVLLLLKGLHDLLSRWQPLTRQRRHVNLTLPVGKVPALVRHPRQRWPQFRRGAQYGKVRRPRHVNVLELKDGLETGGEIEALLAAADRLLTAGADLVGQVWIDEDDGSISGGLDHVGEERNDAAVGTDHALCDMMRLS